MHAITRGVASSFGIGGLIAIRRLLGDLALAVAVVAIDVLLFSRLTEDESRTSWATSSPNRAVIILTSLPIVAALLFRKRVPIVVCIGLCGYSALLTILLGTRPLAALVVALYTASALRPLRKSLACLAVALAAHGVAVAYEVYSYVDAADRMQGGIAIAAFLAVCDFGAWGVGQWAALARAREEHLEQVRDAMAAAIVHDRNLTHRAEPLERRVFISYRTYDTAHAAGRLAEELMRRLGDKRVFIDVVSMRPGVDFRADIADAIARTAVMLVLIGDRWLRSPDGRRRLHEPNDVLRLEIDQAIHTHVKIIPLLIDDAQMPTVDDLPATLQPLRRYSSLRVSARTFKRDVEGVMEAIAVALEDAPGV
jgi:hypothetical protein